MKRLLLAAASAALCAAAVAVPSVPSAAAAPTPLADGYYEPAFGDAVYVVTGSGTAGARSTRVTFDEWTAAGQPAPRALPTSYQQYPWGPDVFAVFPWPEGAESVPLGFDDWQAAGSPAPQRVCNIPQTTFAKNATSPEVFASFSDIDVHKLTFAEWRCAGSPAPSENTNAGYIRVAGSPVIYYSQDLTAQAASPVTFKTWAQQDFPTPRVVRSWRGARA